MRNLCSGSLHVYCVKAPLIQLLPDDFEVRTGTLENTCESISVDLDMVRLRKREISRLL